MVSCGPHPSSADLREVVAALDGAYLADRWFLSDIEANRIGVRRLFPSSCSSTRWRHCRLLAFGSASRRDRESARLPIDLGSTLRISSGSRPRADEPGADTHSGGPFAHRHDPRSRRSDRNHRLRLDLHRHYGSGHRGRSRLRAVLLAGRRVGDDLDAARLASVRECPMSDGVAGAVQA
jgi:hypothetical protein